MTFLKAQGIRGLVGRKDWPRFTEEEPETYEREELDKLLKVCDAEERLWFEFFLLTGMREQEVMYCYWSDVNLSASVVRVAHKPDRGWTPKAYKEREIPIPAKLVTGLKAWKAKSDNTCNLVFPTAGCKPKLDFLDCLKHVLSVRSYTRKTSGFTSLEQLSQRGPYGPESICGPSSNGWVTLTWKARCGARNPRAVTRYVKKLMKFGSDRRLSAWQMILSG